jgi:hypothetical protein
MATVPTLRAPETVLSAGVWAAKTLIFNDDQFDLC